jgi:hypothetical protein
MAASRLRTHDINVQEMPEINRKTLEVLRQPLEEGFVTISRALRSTAQSILCRVYPPTVQLLGLDASKNRPHVLTVNGMVTSLPPNSARGLCGLCSQSPAERQLNEENCIRDPEVNSTAQSALEASGCYDLEML